MKDAKILVIENRPLSQRVLENAVKLEAIVVAFSGLDHVDLDYCAKKMIVVKNTPGYATSSTAELTLCLAIMLLRKIPRALTCLNQSYPFVLGSEVKGKKVGVIGAGAIGLKVGQLFSALDAEVVYFHYKPLKESFLTQVSLERLLSTCDLVTLHVPLNEQTKGLLDQKKLSLCKKGAYLINTARGGLVDQEALLALARNGHFAGVALDVMAHEPPYGEKLVEDLPSNVILTPHIGFRTQEASSNKKEQALAYLRALTL